MNQTDRVKPPLGRRVERAVRERLRDVRVLRGMVIRWRHRGFEPTDAFLVGYPKSGNTWLGGMLSHLATGREFSFDTKDEVTPGVGDHHRRTGILPGGGRLIKSHEPYEPGFGDKYTRLVYMVRDGRDVAISYYHYHRHIGKDPGTIDEFMRRFVEGSLDGWGSWPAHIRSWLGSPHASDGRLLMVRYEDLLERPEEELAAVARFLSLPAEPASIRATVELHTAERMRERERETEYHQRSLRRDVPFIRRAARGEHAEVLTDEQLRRFEEVAGAELARLGYGVGESEGRAATKPGSRRS